MPELPKDFNITVALDKEEKKMLRMIQRKMMKDNGFKISPPEVMRCALRKLGEQQFSKKK